MAKTDFTFRVQALGGKFLADDIGGARIVIHDAVSGEVLAQGITRGDSGVLVGPLPSQPPSTPTREQMVIASKNLITLGDAGAVWWLVPDDGSSQFVASLDLEGPTRVRVVARGPLGGLQSASEVETFLWLHPGQAAPPKPGYVIPLPGLLVQPLSPQIHSQVQPGAKIGFMAKVAMMCGCPITEATADHPAYWPSRDFVVQAQVQQIGANVTIPPYKLAITSAASVFASTSQFEVPQTGQGTVFYEVTFTAIQLSTGNAGTGTVNFFCVY